MVSLESYFTHQRGMVFPWRTPVKLGFQGPEMELTGPVEKGLIGLNSNEWSVQVCPDLKWEVPVSGKSKSKGG